MNAPVQQQISFSQIPLRSQKMSNPSVPQNPSKKIEKRNNSENLYDFFWTGFLTKSKKHQVGIDCFLIKGDKTDLFDDFIFNLNISHRIRAEEVINLSTSVIILIGPSNDTYKQKFEE